MVVINRPNKPATDQHKVYRHGNVQSHQDTWLDGNMETNWVRIGHCVLPPGTSIGYHQHNAAEEVYYVMSGTGRMTVNDKTWDVKVNSRVEQAAFTLWSYLIRDRRLYDLFLKTAYIGQKFLPENNKMISWIPLAGKGWTQSRDLKQLSGRSFIDRFKNNSVKK